VTEPIVGEAWPCEGEVTDCTAELDVGVGNWLADCERVSIGVGAILD
jgi:hypothetical protein